MKKILLKSACLFIPVFAVVILVNYFVDPANVFRSSIADEIVEYFADYEGVEVVGDFNEGSLLKKRVASLSETPDTVIIGSSHVLYVDWQFDDYMNAGMSGEYLDDYFATVGLLEEYNRLPRRLVIAVDPYALMGGLSIRQDSLSDYAEKEKAIVKGEQFTGKISEGLSFSRVKELISFPYFQNSVSALVNGVNASEVNPTNETSVGEKTKILKNGKRVPPSSAYQSAEQCTWDAEWYVSSGSIQVMTEYSELAEKEKEEFTALVDHLIDSGVTVEIYLPGWFDTYYDEFAINPNFSGVIKCEEYIREMASERNITVHGSYNPYEAGVEKTDFLDSLHLTPEAGWDNYNYIRE